ncbi:hypothetical protein FB451DRAFT_1163801 [Mycena latifolia]|nr:hypothetical protein FB451DRAFT_1163801 [Mycena latifolia]
MKLNTAHLASFVANAIAVDPRQECHIGLQCSTPAEAESCTKLPFQCPVIGLPPMTGGRSCVADCVVSKAAAEVRRNPTTERCLVAESSLVSGIKMREVDNGEQCIEGLCTQRRSTERTRQSQVKGGGNDAASGAYVDESTDIGEITAFSGLIAEGWPAVASRG